MSTLEAEIKEGELAQNFKTKYADILASSFNLDFNNPKSISDFKVKIRELVKDAHPDKGGSVELSQYANEVFSNLRSKNASGIKSSLAKLNAVLDNKAGSLTRNKSELNSLKQQFGL